MASEASILRDELPAVLDSRGVDESVGRVAGEPPLQPNGGRGDRRGQRHGAHGPRESLEPPAHGKSDADPSVLGEPGQLVPADRRNGQFGGRFERGNRRGAEPLGFGGPPLHNVGVDQQRAQSNSQSAPVVNSCSSSLTLRATPVKHPRRAAGPLAGISRATVQPVLRDFDFLPSGYVVEQGEDLSLRLACCYLSGHMVTLVVRIPSAQRGLGRYGAGSATMGPARVRSLTSCPVTGAGAARVAGSGGSQKSGSRSSA